MKRKEIWIGVVIDTQDASKDFDFAHIFDSQEEAIEWARGCQELEAEERECISVYIGRISTAIDYAKFDKTCRAKQCPIGPQGVKGLFTDSEVLDIMKLVINNIKTIIIEEGIAYAEEE
mgnify:CR=1 FL=1